MLAELKELWRFRELLITMIEREIRIRYKNSYLGFIWSLLNPLITVAVMTLVFKYVLNAKTGNFSAYVLSAYLPYMFFQMALMDSAQSILAALPVVKKVYFPREILPLASVLSNFIHFLLALAIFFVYLVVVWMRHPGQNPFPATLVYLPLILFVHLALTTGLAFFISALNTFYEDVKYMLGVSLYLLFFLCPIMYFSEQVAASSSISPSIREQVYLLYHLNPVAMICTAYRKIMLQPIDPIVNNQKIPNIPFDWGLFGICAAISITILVTGYWFFNTRKWRFVERP